MIGDPQLVAMLDALPRSVRGIRPSLEGAIRTAFDPADPDEAYCAAVDLFGCSGQLMAAAEEIATVETRAALKHAAAFVAGMAHATRHQALKHMHEWGEYV